MAIVNLTVDNSFVLKPAVVEQVVDQTLKLAKHDLDFEIDVVTVGPKRMQELNNRYRQVNKPTDVLSFGWQQDKKLQAGFLGEIFLCLPIIRQQAKDNNVELKEELIRLIAHGTLHLVGFDHCTVKQEKEMFALQEKVVDYETRKLPARHATL